MYVSKTTRSSQLKSNLSHPVVDSDAHILENYFAFSEFLKEVGGQDMADRYYDATRAVDARGMFWAAPSGERTIDRATVMLPKLYSERLEEAGIDFSITYSTMALRIQHMMNDELRQAGARALNLMMADMFRDVQYRMTPAALIPMYTPEEAIKELEFAVNELGFKAIMVNNDIRRPLPESPRFPELTNFYITSLTIDSPYNYDPFWSKCLELGVAPTAHSSSQGSGTRRSTSNFVYKRLGDFAASADHLARSIFLGGVSRRFPGLNFGFLEGGVGWACQLYNDLFEIWEKRNVDALKTNMDPNNLDKKLMVQMFDEYGTEYLTSEKFLDNWILPYSNPAEGKLDDFEACNIENVEHIKDLFVTPFYFGCEADDRMNVVAFDEKINRFGVKLKAMFGSDIGHWDVLDMTKVLEEAYEPVEKNLMNEDDFRDFTFTNPIMLHAGMNAEFFKGTSVEAAARRVLSENNQL